MGYIISINSYCNFAIPLSSGKTNGISKRTFNIQQYIYFQDDIDKLIDRYNNASWMERQAINQEPLVRKLMEKGIIVEKKEGEQSSTQSLDDKDEEETKEYDSSIATVNEVFALWEEKLIANQIFDYVTKTDCENEDLMWQIYEDGKYPMRASRKSLVEFNYNKDGIKDYILNYNVSNCVGGTGWTTDFIFMTSKNGQLYVNEELTNTLKKKHYAYVSKNYGEDSYVYYDKGFLITKSLEVNKVVDNKCFGKFSLSQDGPNCCPNVLGNFSFDLKSNAFDVYNVKNNNETF